MLTVRGLRRIATMASIMVCLFGISVTAGCKPIQIQRVNEALNSPEFQRLLNRSIAFLIAELANEQESVVPVRDPWGTGPIAGRWFSKAQVTDREDGTLFIRFDGPGYRGHPRASNVLYWATSECIYRPRLHVTGELGYITFEPTCEPTVTFTVYRITAMAELGNTPKYRQEAADEGVKIFADYIRQGFTVGMNRNLEKETWIGVGHRGEDPPKPYWAVPGDHVLVNDKVQVREDGRDFIGPFKLIKGDQIRIDVRTDASWKMDCYLLEDSVARQVLLNHVDRDSHPMQTFTPWRSAECTKMWQDNLIAGSDCVVWIMVDNCDGGGATPPWNGDDDIVNATVYVGVTHHKQP